MFWGFGAKIKPAFCDVWSVGVLNGQYYYHQKRATLRTRDRHWLSCQVKFGMAEKRDNLALQ